MNIEEELVNLEKAYTVLLAAVEAAQNRSFGGAVPASATPASLLRRLRAVQAELPVLQQDWQELTRAKVAFVHDCQSSLLGVFDSVQRMYEQVDVAEPSKNAEEASLCAYKLDQTVLQVTAEAKSLSPLPPADVAAAADATLRNKENGPSPRKERAPAAAAVRVAARKKPAVRPVPAPASTVHAVVPDTPSRLKPPIPVPDAAAAAKRTSRQSSPQQQPTSRAKAASALPARRRAQDPLQETTRRLSALAEQRMASAAFCPISEEEFDAISSAVKGRTSLDEANELYSFLWDQARQCPEVEHTARTLTEHGFKAMSSKTGLSKLNTLRALKLVDLRNGVIAIKAPM